MAKGIDWQKDCIGTMLYLTGMGWERGKFRSDDAEIETIKRNCALLIRMATQKNGGQQPYARSNDIDIAAELDKTLMNIALAASSLCLTGYFGDMPETVSID